MINKRRLSELLQEYSSDTTKQTVATLLYKMLDEIGNAVVKAMRQRHKNTGIDYGNLKSEAIIHAFNKCGRFNGNQKQAYAFCYTIMRNKIVELLRKNRHNDKHIEYIGSSIDLASETNKEQYLFI
jgi:DNA-directed RNA polymerase specialized sigma24 family protein